MSSSLSTRSISPLDGENPPSSNLDGPFGKLAIIMVGLPASGKTFTARNISRYMRWLGIRTRLFSVAHVRNKIIVKKEHLNKRTKIADMVLEDMIRWFGEEKSRVGILDATNTQPDRRALIRTLLAEHQVEIMFLECDYSHKQGHDMALHEHVRELRLVCPEYSSANPHHVLEDFRRRLEYYRPYYKPVGSVEGELEVPFVHFRDGGERIIANRVVGYLRSRVLYYLMNFHNGKKRIFFYILPASGEDLSRYFEPIIKYFRNREEGTFHSLSIWTETSLLSFSIAETFRGHDVLTKPQLRGRDLGVVANLTEVAIQARYPEDYAAYRQDPYKHRYPRAESYHDVAVRLENVIMELEKEPQDVLLLADISVLQCIYAYFMEIPNRDIPNITILTETQILVELTPKAYGIAERKINLEGRDVGLEVSRCAFHQFQENL